MEPENMHLAASFRLLEQGLEVAFPDFYFDFRDLGCSGGIPQRLPPPSWIWSLHGPVPPAPNQTLRQSWLHMPRIECNSNPDDGDKRRLRAWDTWDAVHISLARRG